MDVNVTFFHFLALVWPGRHSSTLFDVCEPNKSLWRLLNSVKCEKKLQKYLILWKNHQFSWITIIKHRRLLLVSVLLRRPSRSLRRCAGARRLLKAWGVLEMIMKIHHFRSFSYTFQAFPKLSKDAGRLLSTFVSSEEPLLHPQPFRSTRGASAPQKNSYKQKAPMFCVIHENWLLVHKFRYFWSFFTLHEHSRM